MPWLFAAVFAWMVWHIIESALLPDGQRIANAGNANQAWEKAYFWAAGHFWTRRRLLFHDEQ